MEFQTIRLPFTRAWTHIEPLSDLHIGHANVDKTKLRECINRIKNDKNRYTFLMGDLFDCTLPNDKFYNEQIRDFSLPEIEHQYQFLVNELRPIRHKILGVHTGNHDERLRLKYFNDVILRLSDELKLKYLGLMALTKINWVSSKGTLRNKSITVFSAHNGYSGARAGGNINNVEDMASSFDADIYLTGHTHNILSMKKVRIGLDKFGRLVEKPQIFAVCGTFQRSYTEGRINYPELKVRRTSRVGTITISIDAVNGAIRAHE